MAFAARVGDTTTHGGIIAGPGDATVLIGNMPAAVVADNHICPIPPPAHIPVSPFPMGSTTVLIGNKPAIRTSDAAVCGAMAAVGEPTVEIG